MATRGPFTTITTEGGLLPANLLSLLTQQPDLLPGTRPDDYHLAPGRRLREAINRSWTELQGACEVPPEPWRTPYAASIVAEFS